VLSLARQDQRIVVTNDLDFGELIFHQQLAHAGVILFRLAEQDITVKQHWLSHVLHTYADQLDQFLVITRRGVRVRRSPEEHVPQDG
jgi:predicted nuclease of predicted toxin-antitoxin system